jgi:F-type H+-transporting ATPase subunit gamma
MKMVAAAKLRKSQESMEKARPYTRAIEDMINHLIPDVDRSILPILESRKANKRLLLVITADRGMAGAFNANVIKKTEQILNEFNSKNCFLICIGKKSHDYFKRRDYQILESYRDFWNSLNINQAIDIGNSIVSKYIDREFDVVDVIYNEFISVGSQRIIAKKLLPIEYNSEEKIKSDIIYEPSKEKIVKTLIPKHLNIQLWQFLLESNASEQAARMVAMENATDNAGEIISDLSIEYNKARQAAITTEIIEIVSGANALEG